MPDSSPPSPSQPLISVVIPTFKRPDLLLERGLASALAQHYPHLEVLVVMDGPDPLTAAALAGVDDARLRPLTLPSNQGPSAARNYGVQNARGEWVAFLDDDDLWRPEKLARQMELAQRSAHPLPVVLSGYITRTPYGDTLCPPRQKTDDETLGDYMLVRGSVTGKLCTLVCTLLMVPQSLALSLPFRTELRNSEDVDWMLRAEEIEGVGFEQLSPQDADALAIYHVGEDRPTGSGDSIWHPMLNWAQEHREAGRLSDRAFAGFLLAQLVPRAVQRGDYHGLPILGRALLSTRPGPSELATFAKHWALPATLRRRLRVWLNTRRAPVRLGSDDQKSSTQSGQK
ncbi:glycosyltransferase family 2 protein [Deinococcus sp. SM5_A1]|uniref:glycosyltransferase family 2 protein n=1 Tax=Deinococcus sp. SM5_A1 TaxID=3379094 RepID=UPI00385AC07A